MPELLHQNLIHKVLLYHMNSIFQKKANDTINNQDTSPGKAKSLMYLLQKNVILLDLILQSLFDTAQNSSRFA